MRQMLLLAGIAALLFVGSPALGDAPAVIDAACPPVDNCTPILYAMHADLFQKEGLAVHLSRMSNGASIAAAVAGGSLQVGMSSMMALITAHAHGVPFVLIAPASVYVSTKPAELMLVRKDSPIRTARDLDGKTLGTSSLKDILAIGTFDWIDRNGGDSKAVKTVEIPLPAILPALESGRIDAATLQEPFLSAALQSGQTRVLASPYDAIGKRFLVTAWFTTSDYVEHDTSVVERFARVMRVASAYANAHPDVTAPLLSAFSRVPLTTIEHSNRQVYGDVLSAAELQPVIDVAARYGLIDAAFDAKEIISPVIARAMTP